MKLPIRKKLFLSHFLAVLLVSGSIGTYFYHSAVDSLMSSLRGRLLNSAAIISQALDARDLASIRSSADTARPAYQRQLRRLRELRRSNGDIAFLYVMQRQQDRVYFVLDSDESAEQAQPGTEYPVRVPALLAGFARPSVDPELTQDEWGTFLSGYAPLRNGEGRYLVGIDMRAGDVEAKFQRIEMAGLLSLALSVLLALLFSRVLSRQLTLPIQALIDRFNDVGAGRIDQTLNLRTGDELDHLIAAYNGMSRRLSESEAQQREAAQALLCAKEELEQRVEERTRDLQALNRQMAHEIAERKQLQAELAQAARTDPLTGLLNRRAMLEHLEHELARSRRTGRPFVVLLGDVDHFKEINDTYGHDVGDRVLIQVAHALSRSLRDEDLIARWGGEEFLLLLPDTGLAGGVAAAEKIRRQFEAEQFSDAGIEISLALSLGVAEMDPQGPVTTGIQSADRALYQAKQGGRNRVFAAERA